MNSNVNFTPDGYHTITPYLICRNAAAAMDFYKRVFDTTELVRMTGPGGRIAHAEIKVGDSCVMLADENLEMGAQSPQAIGGSPVHILVYVKDADTAVNQAVKAGSKLDKPVADQFYGDRSGSVTDPFGHKRTIATHIEDVSPEEMEKRAAKLFGGS